MRVDWWANDWALHNLNWQNSSLDEHDERDRPLPKGLLADCNPWSPPYNLPFFLFFAFWAPLGQDESTVWLPASNSSPILRFSWSWIIIYKAPNQPTDPPPWGQDPQFYQTLVSGLFKREILHRNSTFSAARDAPFPLHSYKQRNNITCSTRLLGDLVLYFRDYCGFVFWVPL